MKIAISVLLVCILYTCNVISKKVFKGSTNTTDRLLKMSDLVNKYVQPVTLSLEYTNNTGFYYKSLREITKDEMIFKIPSSILLSTAEEFPFKSYIFSILDKMPHIQREIGNPQSFYVSLVMMTFRMIFEINVNITNLAKQFSEYSDYVPYVDNPDGYSYIYSLPGKGFYDSANMWTPEEVKYYSTITFEQLGFRGLKWFFDNFIEMLKKENTPESKYLVKYIYVSFEQYEWAYNMVNTR